MDAHPRARPRARDRTTPDPAFPGMTRSAGALPKILVIICNGREW